MPPVMLDEKPKDIHPLRDEGIFVLEYYRGFFVGKLRNEV
jgi:hypothetical protein